jgi:hypothetical protein
MPLSYWGWMALRQTNRDETLERENPSADILNKEGRKAGNCLVQPMLLRPLATFRYPLPHFLLSLFNIH